MSRVALNRSLHDCNIQGGFSQSEVQLTYDAKRAAFELTRQLAAIEVAHVHRASLQILRLTGMRTFPINAAGSFARSRWHRC
jgi:hypothetical protein